MMRWLRTNIFYSSMEKHIRRNCCQKTWNYYGKFCSIEWRNHSVTDLFVGDSHLTVYSEAIAKVSALIKQNKFLAKKNLKTEDTAVNACKKETDDGNDLKSPEEALTGSAAANIQVDESTATMASLNTIMETTLSHEEGSLDAGSTIEPLRTIEPTQLNFKCLFLAFLALLASIFAVYLFQLEY